MSDRVVPLLPRRALARKSIELTEDALALAFIEMEEDYLRYDHSRGCWAVWSETHWKIDETGEVLDRIRNFCASHAGRLDATQKADAKRLSSLKNAISVERFASVDRRVAITHRQWGKSPFLLATPNGTVNLKTGSLREPRPDDMIDRITAVGISEPGDECPLWLQFLNDACVGDADQIRFLQKMCGYALTGDTREHALFFIYGPGGNGKGIFLNVLTGILGEYAITAPMEAFTSSRNERHSTELAMMAGARLVTASETEEGKRWAEAKIKQLTGGDKISARFMRQDFFEYTPIFKLLIVGNHMPSLSSVDDAARRRFRMVPFENKPITDDKQLGEKLKPEWPAILRWMVDGCVLWLKEGIEPPQSVSTATNNYFSDQDILQQWIDERCTVDRDAKCDSVIAFIDWSSYATKMSEEAGTKNSLTQSLRKRGYICKPTTINGSSCRAYFGLKLKYGQPVKPDDELPLQDE